MNNLTEAEREIAARTDKAESMVSDDFGHDTHALLVAESQALGVAADDITALLTTISELRGANPDAWNNVYLREKCECLEAYFTGKVSVFSKDGDTLVELINEHNGKPLYLKANCKELTKLRARNERLTAALERQQHPHVEEFCRQRAREALAGEGA